MKRFLSLTTKVKFILIKEVGFDDGEPICENSARSSVHSKQRGHAKWGIHFKNFKKERLCLPCYSSRWCYPQAFMYPLFCGHTGTPSRLSGM